MAIDPTDKTNEQLAPFEFVDFANVVSVPCPCGQAKRAFAETNDFPGTVHVTEISLDAKNHYHKQHSEVYYFLECDDDAKMELNGEQIAVRPGICILIRPNTLHRAIGQMRVLIISMPKFDPQDEFFG